MSHSGALIYIPERRLDEERLQMEAKKREREELLAKRAEKARARLAARGGGGSRL